MHHGAQLGPLLEAAAQFRRASVICAAGKADDPIIAREALDKVFHEYGRLDILINNAGINPVYGATLDAIRARFGRSLTSTSSPHWRGCGRVSTTKGSILGRGRGDQCLLGGGAGAINRYRPLRR